MSNSYKIELTSNVQEIKEILKNDYNTITYDGCLSFDYFEPDLKNSLWFKLLWNGENAGLIRLENMNFTTWIPHIIIKKEYRGKGSEEWGKQVVQYMKNIFKSVNFLIITPYVTAKKYAERVGFKYTGILPKSIKKDGELMDQYILVGDGSFSEGERK